MVKRIFDFLIALIGLILLSPILLIFMFLIWLEDRHSPFYLAPRVGKNGKMFKMVKLRSMVVNADKSGVDSTSSSDSRITKIGYIIRKYKLDEFSQLINVFIGQMSLVGPRPQVQRDVELYTDIEKNLLDVNPGITDFSSIIFSDEGEILKDSKNPDLDYNQLIRPWKSRLGLFYIRNRSFFIDIKIILMTIMAIVSKSKALKSVNRQLVKLGASKELIDIASRKDILVPFPPPGSDEIVTSRD
ncbi:MAG: sugar transferase [Candidatus Neomarinimicrobiota bacterium]|jgi:lipopolysaccharide/colanic/teichoic acid biosynthesis glycosyltransferase